MATIAVLPDQSTVTGEIFIAAPPERVFEAITKPEQIMQWWGQKGMYRGKEWKADVRPGGKWSNLGVNEKGEEFTVSGEYLEVDPPRLLVYTWLASWTGSLKTTVRWELEPKEIHGLQANGPRKAGVGTLLRIRHEGFGPAPEACANHAQGWTRVLAWMQAFVETGETVDTRAPFVAV
jgi:uncharacterized protein YndB with AHSA1/START domain